MSDAASMALLTTGVAVATAEYAAIHKGGGFVMKPVIAGFGLGLFVLAVYSANDALGAAFAWLIIIGSILTNGLGLLTGFTKLVSPTPVKKTPPKKG